MNQARYETRNKVIQPTEIISARLLALSALRRSENQKSRQSFLQRSDKSAVAY